MTRHDRQRTDHRGGHLLAGSRGGTAARRLSSGFRVGRARSATSTATTCPTSAFRRRSGTSSRRRAGSTTTRCSRASPASAPAGSRARTTSRDVIELLRLNYDRLVARHGVPAAA